MAKVETDNMWSVTHKVLYKFSKYFKQFITITSEKRKKVVQNNAQTRSAPLFLIKNIE